MKYTLGFSPCPNDTFIFDALIHEKLSSPVPQFETVIEDVEALNLRALSGELDVTKLSFHAWLHVQDKYDILSSGAALGRGVGPLFISRNSLPEFIPENYTVAIPGKYTTANLLFSLFFPNIKCKRELVFSEIENAVLSEKVDAGVIIHENRFTYADKGLFRIADLGELWEKETDLPIPLGCIAVKKSLGLEFKNQMQQLLQQSVQFAINFPEASNSFVQKYAAEMDLSVQRKHIELYVNQYTIDLGVEGWDAVQNFKKKWEQI